MDIINAGYNILTDINRERILKSIEVAGRTCYKSEEKITDDSASAFVKMLIKRGHEAMIEHESISVRFICDRGVSHELVRHRIASFAQESTRYVNYSKGKFGSEITVINPLFFDPNEELVKVDGCSYLTNKYDIWDNCMEHLEKAYMMLIELGAKPEEARSILPNSLKTEIVVTMNLREWRHFFKLRTAKVAHPSMREVTIPLLEEMKVLLPEIFEDIEV